MLCAFKYGLLYYLDLLNPRIISILAKGSKYVNYIHITDQRADLRDDSITVKEVVQSPVAMRVQFKLPPADKMNELLPLMESIFLLMDAVPKITLSKQVKCCKQSICFLFHSVYYYFTNIQIKMTGKK